MGDLILCTILFVFTFILRFLFYLKGSKKKSKGTVATDMMYLVNRFKLDIDKIDKKSIAAIISMIDALIISITLFVTLKITDNIVLEMLIGAILVVALIILFNEIFGRILKKRGYGRDE